VDLVEIQGAIAVSTSLDKALVLVVVAELLVAVQVLVSTGKLRPRSHGNKSLRICRVDGSSLNVVESKQLFHGYFLSRPSCT